MAIVIKPITIEVSKPNAFQAIAAKQNDSNSRFLKATFVNEGEKIKVGSSATVMINFERSDGQSKSYSGEVNNDGTATLPIHSWALSMPGYVNCDISIIENDGKLTSTTFTLLVEKASNPSENISDDPQYDVLLDLIKKTEGTNVAELQQEIETINNTLRDTDQKLKKTASAINNKTSGTYVKISDISPTEHTLDVKVSGEYGNKKLFRYGGNFFDYNGIKNNYRETQGYTKYRINLPNGLYSWYLCGDVNFTGTGAYALFTDEVHYNGVMADENCVHSWIGHNTNGTNTNGTFAVTQGFIYLAVDGKDIEFIAQNLLKELMLSPCSGEGEISLEFEPYVSATSYDIDADGKVSGVTSLYPTTILMCICNNEEGSDESHIIEATYNVDTKKYVDKAFTEIDTTKAKLRIIENTISKPFTEKDIDPVFGNNPWELITLVCQYGNPSKYWKAKEYKMLEINGGNYPMQILGFNHDKATDPYAYGKKKTGMTLMLGASRNVYGDGASSLYTKSIEGLMDDRGYFKAPNRVLKDYTDGATNWSESGFRLALQTLFDETEIANYIVPVQKYTSRYYKQNIYWSDALITNDKVFLPSEYEIFGQQILAPYIEGEQYEFFKDGYSKFMWSDNLLNGTSKIGRLWLRSAYATKVNANFGDSNYSLNVYLGVNSRNPVNVLYSPSYANVGDGVIAPCICL